MTRLTIAVSGTNSTDNPAPGIGVAKSLREWLGLDVSVLGLAYDALETGAYLDGLCDRTFIVPYPSAGTEALLERLRYIKATEGLDFVIPTLDVEIPLYTRLAPTLAAEGIGTFLPTDEQFRLRGKDLLPEVAAAIGISVPATAVVSSLEELVASLERLAFPVMVKGAFYKAYRAYTTQEAISHYHALVAEWGYPVIVQETVAGEELNLVAVGDGEGDLLGHASVKKIGITSLGKIWTGVTVNSEPMAAAARRFAHAYRWRGAFELECIADGDRVYLIEINPRFPAWSYFATALGINLPANMLRKALGRPLPAIPEAAAGKLYLRYTEEHVCDLGRFQDIVTMGETR